MIKYLLIPCYRHHPPYIYYDNIHSLLKYIQTIREKEGKKDKKRINNPLPLQTPYLFLYFYISLACKQLKRFYSTLCSPSLIYKKRGQVSLIHILVHLQVPKEIVSIQSVSINVCTFGSKSSPYCIELSTCDKTYSIESSSVIFSGINLTIL